MDNSFARHSGFSWKPLSSKKFTDRASKLFWPEKSFLKISSLFFSLQFETRPRHSTASHFASLDRSGDADRSSCQDHKVWKWVSQFKKVRQHFKMHSSEAAEKKSVFEIGDKILGAPFGTTLRADFGRLASKCKTHNAHVHEIFQLNTQFSFIRWIRWFITLNPKISGIMFEPTRF